VSDRLTIVFPVRLSPEQHGRLLEASRRREFAAADAVREAVRDWCDRQEQQATPVPHRPARSA
jgi:Arc/MetJ-type ribon-helix-helix transcriptional regulator